MSIVIEMDFYVGNIAWHLPLMHLFPSTHTQDPISSDEDVYMDRHVYTSVYISPCKTVGLSVVQVPVAVNRPADGELREKQGCPRTRADRGCHAGGRGMLITPLLLD